MPLTHEDLDRSVPLLREGVERVEVAGGCRLRSEPFPRGPVRRLLGRVFRLPERLEVELDDIGAFVVDHLDGRTLAELTGTVAGHLKLSRLEAKAAVGVFVKALLRRRLVRLDQADGTGR